LIKHVLHVFSVIRYIMADGEHATNTSRDKLYLNNTLSGLYMACQEDDYLSASELLEKSEFKDINRL
jgi:hypothetical protein